MGKPRYVSMGPNPVALVPISQFSRVKVSDLKAVWEIIGPTVDRNLNSKPLWIVIATAYIEGINHGYGLAVDEQKRSERRSDAL